MTHRLSDNVPIDQWLGLLLINAFYICTYLINTNLIQEQRNIQQSLCDEMTNVHQQTILQMFVGHLITSAVYVFLLLPPVAYFTPLYSKRNHTLLRETPRLPLPCTEDPISLKS